MGLRAVALVLALSCASVVSAQAVPPAATRAIYECGVSASHFGGSDVSTSVVFDVVSGRVEWTRNVQPPPSSTDPPQHLTRAVTLAPADRTALATRVAAALAEHSPPSQPAIMDGEACSLRIVGTGEATLLQVQRQTSPSADAVWRLIDALISIPGLPFRG